MEQGYSVLEFSVEEHGEKEDFHTVRNIPRWINASVNEAGEISLDEYTEAREVYLGHHPGKVSRFTSDSHGDAYLPPKYDMLFLYAKDRVMDALESGDSRSDLDLEYLSETGTGRVWRSFARKRDDIDSWSEADSELWSTVYEELEATDFRTGSFFDSLSIQKTTEENVSRRRLPATQ